MSIITQVSVPASRSTSFFVRALGGGLAATSLVLVNLGCGCSGDLIDRDIFTVGCLVEGEVDGDAAEAQATLAANATTVTLWSGADAHGAVITIPEASLATLPVGELPADANVAVEVCDAVGACVPVRDVVLEVVDLGDGTARAHYTGTTLGADDRAQSAEGSFVFVRSESPRGI